MINYYEIGALLKEIGFTISDSRLPYTYHHDYVRSIVGGSRADVAGMMNDFERDFGAEAYRMAIARGALIYLIGEQPLNAFKVTENPKYQELIKSLKCPCDMEKYYKDHCQPYRAPH